MNGNDNTTYQNFQDAAIAALSLLLVNAYIKEERSPLNNLTLHFKEIEKVEQTKPNVSKRKEIIKIRAKINEIENRKKFNKTKSWFLKR